MILAIIAIHLIVKTYKEKPGMFDLDFYSRRELGVQYHKINVPLQWLRVGSGCRRCITTGSEVDCTFSSRKTSTP